MDSPSAGAHCKQKEGKACCRFGEWNLKDVDFLNQVQLITAKPVVYLVNLPEKMYIKKKSKWLPKVPLAVTYLSAYLQRARWLFMYPVQGPVFTQSCSVVTCTQLSSLNGDWSDTVQVVSVRLVKPSHLGDSVRRSSKYISRLFACPAADLRVGEGAWWRAYHSLQRHLGSQDL